MNTTTTNIGELISLFYEEFMALYGDEELASIATAAVINDLMADDAALASQRAERAA